MSFIKTGKFSVKIAPNTISPHFHSSLIPQLFLSFYFPCLLTSHWSHHVLVNFFRFIFLFTHILSLDVSVIFNPSVRIFLVDRRGVFHHLHFWTLLRYSVCAIKHICLNCTIRWVLVKVCTHGTTTTVKTQNISITPKSFLVPIWEVFNNYFFIYFSLALCLSPHPLEFQFHMYWTFGHCTLRSLGFSLIFPSLYSFCCLGTSIFLSSSSPILCSATPRCGWAHLVNF